MRHIRNDERSKLRTATYNGVALCVGFGSMNQIILVLWFTDASSSSGPFMLRFLGRNGGGAAHDTNYVLCDRKQ